MTKDKITGALKQHYQKSFKEHGANSKGVDWGEQNQADLRYQVMQNVILKDDLTSVNGVSVLDVGCGYGGQYLFAKSKGLKMDYTGIDVVPEMIVHAKNNIPDAEFYCESVFDFPTDNRFDYVICNGILTQRLKASITEMEDYTHKIIPVLFDFCRKGLVFNMLTTKVDFINEQNFYKSPIELLAYLLTLTQKVKLDHSYPLYEYSVYLYK